MELTLKKEKNPVPVKCPWYFNSRDWRLKTGGSKMFESVWNNLGWLDISIYQVQEISNLIRGLEANTGHLQ